MMQRVEFAEISDYRPATGGLEVRCFGAFEVARDGVVVHDWRRDKARTLLKHLIARRGSISRDILLDLLWPELDTESAARNLRVTLHALRRAVSGKHADGDFVLTRADAYELNRDKDVWIDIEVFSSLVETGRRLERQGRPSAAMGRFEAAQLLYRDDYLIEDLYADWTFGPRERLKDDYLLVVTRLADAALEAGDDERCIEYCHKLLARDPCREDAYQRLMRCHTRLGRRSRALRWYQLCRETLQRELGLEPNEVTRGLAAHIAAGASLTSLDRVELTRLAV
jgi:LuxR family transcriptional regulator, maltose regulon positive regulatory protein